jgi:hypothetical protein
MLLLRLCLCVLAIQLGVITCANSVMNVPGHTLFTAYEDALPVDILDSLKEEARKAGKWSAETADSFMYGQRSTFWFLTDDPAAGTTPPVPRNNVEKAILHLRQFALRDIHANRPNDRILGAEWWVQIRSGSEDIGFHYDKDEAMASLQSVMKHPLISTVTYLSDIGSPTLIFNQTTNGNDETPEIPALGYLCYPKLNRHVTFSGDLQHGVLGSASQSGRVPEGRVTLLINWWDTQPLEPNTIVVTEKLLSDIGIDKPPKSTAPTYTRELEAVEVDIQGGAGHSASSGSAAAAAAAVRAKRVPVATLSTVKQGARRHEVTLPPGDRLFLNLPQSLTNGGIHRLEWAWDEIYGNLGILDLQVRNQVSQLFRLPQPKVLFLYKDSGKAGKKMYEDMLEAILPLTKTYVGSLKVYFAPTSKAKDVLGAFSLTEKDLPALVIDDTAAGAKHVQPKADFAFTAEAVEAFVKAHVALEGKENLFL